MGLLALAAPKPPLYTGAYLGVLAGGGLAIAEGEAGVGAVAGVRASTVLHLADVEARYQLASETHQGLVSVHLHPLFLFLLANSRLGATLGSLSLELGGGPASGPGGFGLVWVWGGGVQVPLTEPDEGQSLWLGGAVTRTSNLAYEALGGVTTHLLLRLEYRHNGW